MLTSNQSNPPEGELHSFWFRFPQHFIMRQRYSNTLNMEEDWSRIVLKFLQLFFCFVFEYGVNINVGFKQSAFNQCHMYSWWHKFKRCVGRFRGILSLSRVVLCVCVFKLELFKIVLKQELVWKIRKISKVTKINLLKLLLAVLAEKYLVWFMKALKIKTGSDANEPFKGFIWVFQFPS